MEALDRLLLRIGDPQDVTKPHPLVSLEEFFVGNEDRQSIGPFAQSRFGPADFFDALSGLRACVGIHDIRVEILPELSPKGWPCSNTVWIVSDFDRRELPRRLPREFWERYLPSDWLSYPRIDRVVMEPLDIPTGACVQGFAYY